MTELHVLADDDFDAAAHHHTVLGAVEVMERQPCAGSWRSDLVARSPTAGTSGVSAAISRWYRYLSAPPEHGRRRDSAFEFEYASMCDLTGA
jgi:hypothetical protein